MSTDANRVVIQGEVVVEGTSLFVRETGEVAWIVGFEGNHVRVETVSDCIRIPMEQFQNRIVDEDYVLEGPPVGRRTIE